MKAEDITSEYFLGVCRLYAERLGRRDSRLKRILEDQAERHVRTIRENGFLDERRVGSRYDSETKLGFTKDSKTREVRPKVNLNFLPHRRKGERYEEAQRAVEQFMKESIKYLSQN